MISRRAWLAGSIAAAAGCGRRKATGYQGYCMVANREDKTLGVVDLNNFHLRKEIPLDAAPAAVVADPARPRAFALAPEAGTVYEIDALTLSVTRRIKVGNTALEMHLAPKPGAVWVLTRDPSALVEIPLENARAGRRIPVPAGDIFAVDKLGHAAAANWREHSLALVSLEHGKVERTVETAAEPSLLHFRWDGETLLTGNRPERSITVLDVATGKTVVRLPLALAPRNFCSNADDWLFISGDGMDAVVVVFPSHNEIWQTSLAGKAPGAMAVAEGKPGYLLAANPDTGTVTALDMLTENLVAVVEVGREPGFILVTPDQQYALVLNRQSGDMAVIRLLSLSAARNQRVLKYRSASLFDMVAVGRDPVSAAVVNWEPAPA
jgi:DNA-binding beta-propeller fold protein YncE